MPCIFNRPSVLPAIGENQPIENDAFKGQSSPANADGEEADTLVIQGSLSEEKWVPVVELPSPPDGGWGWVSHNNYVISIPLYQLRI